MRASAAVLSLWLLAAPSSAGWAQQKPALPDLGATFQQVVNAAALFPAIPSALGAPVANVGIRFPPAHPDSKDSNDAFRKGLLDPARSDQYLLNVASGTVLLAVEKGYLDAAALERLAKDIREAARGIPSYAGKPSKIKGRFTVYVYDQGPLSESDVPGAQPGELGVMLRFVKEDEAPLFHEFTHLLTEPSLAQTPDQSQSLSEGFADHVEERFRPGKAYAFVPAGTDPHAEAKRALARRPAAFFEAVGGAGYNQWSAAKVRQDFYYASWSFVDYLIGLRGVAPLRSVEEAGAADAAYQKAYGKSLIELRVDWRRWLASRP